MSIYCEVVEGKNIPFLAFWLRSSVVSGLISSIYDVRLSEPHDIDLIFPRCVLIRELAVRPHESRHGIAIS